MSQTEGITLPDPGAIRARINQLSDEANKLRRLLRAVNRLREKPKATIDFVRPTPTAPVAGR